MAFPLQGPPGEKGDPGATEIIDYNGNIQEALQVRPPSGRRLQPSPPRTLCPSCDLSVSPRLLRLLWPPAEDHHTNSDGKDLCVL